MEPDSRKLRRPNVLRGPGEPARVIGHRGAPGSAGLPPSREARAAASAEEAGRYAPENTLASFERAVGMGADLIELDVHLSADNQVVVIHDETVDRTTTSSGDVAMLSLAELRTLDAGGWYAAAFSGQRIPTLDEVLAWARGRTRVAIEIKSGGHAQPGIEEKLVDLLAQHQMIEDVVVISFDHPTVARVKGLCPDVAIGLLYACRPVDAVALARQANADLLLPHWSYANAEDVAAAHSAGLGVAPWATSEPAILRWLLAIGVDAVGTNHPDRMRALVTSDDPSTASR